MERSFYRRIRFGLAITLVAIACAVCVAHFPTSDSQLYAGWFQAFGSIAAIIGTAWVIDEQQERERRLRAEDDKLKEARLLRAIRGEVTVLLALFHNRIGNDLARAPKGSVFNIILRTQPTPFSVYDNSVSQLGVIESDEIRLLVIEAYARFNGFLAVIHLNNEMVIERGDEFRANGFKLSDERNAFHDARMRDVGDQIIDRYAEVLTVAGQVQEKLAAY